MENMNVVINKFVILPKLINEVGQVDFSFKKWGVAVHTRYEREWVSYDLKGNKVKCLLKRNGDTRRSVWHSYKENGNAHVWHSHKDKGEDTQGICATFTQRKVGHFHSEKEAKRCGRPNKIRVMCEIKGNNKEVYS